MDRSIIQKHHRFIFDWLRHWQTGDHFDKFHCQATGGSKSQKAEFGYFKESH